MPMWRCPHCGTPQAETARCWVCRRSSTACGTCRNFRHSVAGSLGYCGLDRGRQPLVGDEIRACWEARPAGTEPTVGHLPPPAIRPAEVGVTGMERAQPLAFVEVRDGSLGQPPSVPDEPSNAPETSEPPPTPIRPRDEPGWSLWGEFDR